MVSQDTYRSRCPISFSLETFGDKWSLLILRDIIYFGKHTFGEFLASDERIARNILADRLTRLQATGLLTKAPHPADKRRDIYRVSDSGLDVIPLLLSMAEWGSSHGHDTKAPAFWLALTQTRRDEMVSLIRQTVQAGGSIFVGDKSVIAQL